MICCFYFRICVVCIAENHPICREKKDVKKINFEVKGSNRLDNKMSGKSKRVCFSLYKIFPLKMIV